MSAILDARDKIVISSDQGRARKIFRSGLNEKDLNLKDDNNQLQSRWKAKESKTEVVPSASCGFRSNMIFKQNH